VEVLQDVGIIGPFGELRKADGKVEISFLPEVDGANPGIVEPLARNRSEINLSTGLRYAKSLRHFASRSLCELEWVPSANKLSEPFASAKAVQLSVTTRW